MLGIMLSIMLSIMLGIMLHNLDISIFPSFHLNLFSLDSLA